MTAFATAASTIWMRYLKRLLPKVRLLTSPWLALGVLLLVYAAFGIFYLQQQQQQRTLVSKLAITRKVAHKQAQAHDGLAKEFDQAFARLTTIWFSFPKEGENTAVIEAVQRTIAQSGIELVSIKAGSAKTEQIGESSHPVSSFILGVRGDPTALIAFVNELETKTFKGLVVRSLKLNSAASPATLTVNFSIYAQGTRPAILEAMLPDSAPSYFVIVDTNEPETVLEPPHPNPTNKAARVTGRASDATTGITLVEYRVDQGNWLAAAPLDGAFDSAEEAFCFTVEGLSEGLHLLESRAVDEANNVELSYAATSLTVDPRPPLVTIALPHPHLGVTAESTLTLQGHALDATSAIASVEYRVDGGEWLPAIASDGAFDRPEEEYIINLSDVEDGPHIIQVRASDAAGNTSLPDEDTEQDSC